MILPVTALVAGQNVERVWRAGQDAGAHVHFFVMRPIYLREISNLSGNEPRLMVYNWGGAFLRSSGVVYDQSDEIAAEHPSDAWKKRADKTDLACPFGSTPIGHHFYFVSFDC